MKVHFKRLAAAAVAVAMSLSLSVSAFAAKPLDDCSLTVKGEGLDGKTVYAIRMFTADVDVPEESGENNTNTFVNYELEGLWIPFFEGYFKTEGMDTVLTDAGITLPEVEKPSDEGDALTAWNEAYQDAALSYLEWLATKEGKTETDYVAFADAAEVWFYKNAFTVTGEASNREATLKEDWNAVVKTATGTAGAEDQPDQAVFNTASGNALRSGYYLILPDGGSTGNGDRGSDAILYNIPHDAGEKNTIEIKSTYPTVDKTVDDGNTTTPGKEEDSNFADDGSAQVGDEVTFTLTAKVPDMSNFDTYYFAFIDTLSKGLDLSIADGTFAKTDVTVYIYNAEKGERADDNHKVSVDDFNASYVTDSSKTLKVEFSDLKTVQVNNDNVEAGDTIQVVYKATINEEAVTGQNESFGNAENSVKLEYSNNPSDDGHGESTPDITKVYTYDIDVNKWALSGQEDKPETDEVDESKIENLADAQFILSTNATAPTEEQIENDYKGYSGLISLVKNSNVSYRVATTEDQSTQKSFATVDTGDINIAGLEAGIYYLHEVKAPDDYNKLKAPVKIEIVVTKDDYENATIKVNDKTVEDEESTGFVVNVENKQGIELPETGSIGTIGLTVAGVVIVAIGLFAMPRKKKDQD